MPRTHNPRRVLLEMLKMPRKRIDWIHREFDGITRHVYDRDQRDEHGNATRRPRRQSEYPENDPQKWIDVYEQAYSAIQELSEIMTHARRQGNEARIRRDVEEAP